ncbi:hypothetical protein [Chitinophaga sp.]|uniref:hypothetical protein n=1 Tax=Chitinophaga sp. TaxID=1869181 RepID=UPI002F94F5D4
MKKIVFLSLIISLNSCSKKDNVPDPGKATLVFPEQNAACTTGSVISDTESSITFTWNASDHTDSYVLNIKNLLTQQVTSREVITNKATVTLLRNVPYSWFVKSMSSGNSASTESNIWKFYNSGPGVTSYAPFPAAIVSPTFGQNITASNTVNLKWAGSDVDNDITAYSVYFGTNATPALLKDNVTDMFLNDVPVNSNMVYYWKIITHDGKGNTSDSGTFQFKVN